MTGNNEIDERQENFDQVWHAYQFEETAAALAPIFDMSELERDWLLRHHGLREVTKPKEIEFRAELDYFLHGCGVLEVGFCSGSLATSHGSKVNLLMKFLHDPKVRLFSEKRYPLRLPARLRKRIESNVLVPQEQSQASWYARILSLDARFRDTQLDRFFMMVDEFWFEGLGFDDLKAAAREQQAMIAALTTPRAKRTSLQEALAGLERFLLFCRDLDELLDAAQPVAGEAAFDLYRYWFDIRHSELAQVVDDALSALVTIDSANQEPQLPERAAMAALFDRANRTKPQRRPK